MRMIKCAGTTELKVPAAVYEFTCRCGTGQQVVIPFFALQQSVHNCPKCNVRYAPNLNSILLPGSFPDLVEILPAEEQQGRIIT